MEWLTYSLLPLLFSGWMLMRWRKAWRVRRQQEMVLARMRMAEWRLRQPWEWFEPPPGPRSHRKR